MNAKGIDQTEENLDLNRKIAKPLASECDVRERREIAQSIIDRLIDRKFAKEYLYDLLKLNHKYSFQYEIRNGLRIYLNSIPAEETVPSQPVQELGEISVDEAGNFLYNKPEANIQQEQDVYQRAQIVQDCIDRILNADFGREYQEVLLILNSQYPIEFEVKNGAQVYSTDKLINIETEKAADALLIPSETSGSSVKEIDSLVVLNQLVKNIGSSNIAPKPTDVPLLRKQVSASDDAYFINFFKPSYLIRRSKTINRKLKRDLSQSPFYHQIHELVETTYRRLLEPSAPVIAKQSSKQTK